MHLRAKMTSDIRANLTMDERWNGVDRGLIASWERGREKALEDPALAARAQAGELVPLPWKGGGDAPLKSGKRVGVLYYLAMWQGLRGDDLNVNMAEDATLTCTRHGVAVTFTSDYGRYANA